MRIKDYLDEILNTIAKHPFVVSQSISLEERPPNTAFITGSITFTIQSVITSHTCVAPRLVVAAYAKNTPHSSPSSRLGLLCSDALYVDLFMLLCLKTEKSNEAQQKPPQAVVYLLSYPVFLLSLSADECFQSPFLIEVPLKHPPFLLCAVFYE